VLVVGVDFDVDVSWLEVLGAANFIEPYCSICLQKLFSDILMVVYCSCLLGTYKFHISITVHLYKLINL
jgi:hypothetical protein